jgi:hypothetical protein
MSERELIKLVRRSHPGWKKPEDLSIPVLKEQMLSQIEDARKSVGRKRETKEDKKRRQLKAKSVEQLRELLDDIEVIYPSGAGAKALRKIAEEHDALGKWDAIPDHVKLEKNRARAVKNLQDIDEAKAAAREKRRQEDKFGGSPDQIPAKDPKDRFNLRQFGPKKNKWEIDFDKFDEEAMMDRLRNLHNYDEMTPREIEQLMEQVRSDPNMIKRIEADDRLQRQVKMAEEDGIELTLGDMQRMGANVMSFDKSRRLDEIKMDAAGMRGANPGKMAGMGL